MYIRWHGYSCFEFADDKNNVVFDPHDGKSIGVFPPKVSAKLALCTHNTFDRNAFRVVGGKHKDVFHQIEKNPRVEVSGFKGPDIIRYYGKAVVDDNPALFDKAVKVLPLLAQIYNEKTGFKLALFYLEDAKAEYSNVVDYSLKKQIEL